MARPFRFGVASRGRETVAEWKALARKVEELGYSTLVVSDHFRRQPAPLLELVSAADATTTLRLGTTVLDNDFRHPAILAKEAATADWLTGGRLELGVGAGYLVEDYEQSGIPFEPAAVRFERLIETVQILKAFFGEDSVTFDGKHYHLSDLPAYPKPTQRPGPPLMIGGRQRGMLSFAAREADIIGILMFDRVLNHPNPPTFEQKIGWVREAAGDRFDQIEFHTMAANLTVTADPEGALEAISAREGVPPDALLESPTTIVGSVDSVCEQLEAWRERVHLSYVTVPDALMDMAAPVVARLAGR